jgi:hypothetical protein
MSSPLQHNDFEMRPERIFITYNEVIRNPYVYLFNKIDTKLRDFYKDFIDVDKFKGLNDKNMLRFLTERTDKQPFRFLAKRDFDMDDALKELMHRYPKIYEESPLLDIGDQIHMMLTQKFTEKIFVYTEEYDVRVHADIQKLYNNMERVTYVSGDFAKLIQRPELDGITTYIVNDLDYIYEVLEAGKADYVNFLLAKYAYNYIYNEDDDKMELRMDMEDMMGEAICKIAMFTPARFTEEHFTQYEFPEHLMSKL